MPIGPEDVERIASGGENARAEFKLGLPAWPKVARTLAAFANGRGGTLLVGIDDHGRTRGVRRAAEVLGELERIAEAEIEPPIDVRCTVVAMGGERDVVACEVGLSDRRPHAARRPEGEPEVTLRLGSSTRSAGAEAVRAMRSGGSSRSGLSELERSILTWVGRQVDPGSRRAAPATVAGFAKAHNVGRSRARRAFWKLEHAGRLVGHGEGESKAFALP